MPRPSDDFARTRSSQSTQESLPTKPSSVEIFCLRMMHHNRIGALLGNEHEIFIQRHPNFLRLEQLHDLCAVFQTRAGGISKTVPAAAISLLKNLFDLRRIFRPESQFLPHAL